MRTSRLLSFDDLDAFRAFSEKLSDQESNRAIAFAIKALELEMTDVVVSAEFQEEKIVSAFLGYSGDAAAGIRDNKIPLIPFWIMGRYMSLDSLPGPQARVRTESLGQLLITHFESMGFISFYMARPAPRSIQFSNCRAYQEKISSGIFSITRYTPTVEFIVESPEGASKLPRSLSCMMYEKWPNNKHVIIVRYSLQEQYRTNLKS